jgi:hypothetical protein
MSLKGDLREEARVRETKRGGISISIEVEAHIIIKKREDISIDIGIMIRCMIY